MSAETISAPHPLSEDERTAMTRCVANIKKQLQDMSDLFGSRYGETNSLTNLSSKALVCAALLEDELVHLEESEKTDDFTSEESAIVKTAFQGR